MKRTKNTEAMALVAAVLFIAMLTMVLGAVALRSIYTSNQTTYYIDYEDCFDGVEAALMRGWVDAENGGTGLLGTAGWEAPENPDTIPLPLFTADGKLPEGVEPITLAANKNIEYYSYALDWSNDGYDNNGDGNVDEPAEDGIFTIYGFARSGGDGGITRGVEMVIRGDDVNVWNNAIFAGAGQAGGLINGNVAIHGSVHLLGESLVGGATAIEALDLSGTALIHNNYAGIPAALSGRIPPLPTRQFGGETVQTLDAKLRVKKGLVGLSGNSEIGEPNVTGNTLKETMDGTFVNDGWTGNKTVADGGRGIPGPVYSDNGHTELYDLGNRVTLPVLSDDYRDIDGNTVFNPGTGANYTHEEYFTDVLTGAVKEGDVTIKANQNFYYNATRPTDPNPANRQPTDDYILFNAATNVMEMNGQIKIKGNLLMDRGTGSDNTIHYTGRAAILVDGNVQIDVNLYSRNADGTTANSFPKNNILGIMASGDMIVGSNAQLHLMGAFYAQGKIKSTKQTIVTGTYVSNYFDMGTNVPEIYQVPTLRDNLPMGMIGMFPIFVYSRVSWREINPRETGA